MTKFTFTYEYGKEKKLTFHTESATLTDILEDFEYFLKGAGFHFNGTIDIIEDDYEQNK